MQHINGGWNSEELHWMQSESIYQKANNHPSFVCG